MRNRLLPRPRVRVQQTLSLAPGPRPFCLRELARTSGVALAAQRELANLAGLGMVRRVPRGREVYCHLQEEHPLVMPLRTFLRVAGVSRPPPPRHDPPTKPAAACQPGREAGRVW